MTFLLTKAKVSALIGVLPNLAEGGGAEIHALYCDGSSKLLAIGRGCSVASYSQHPATGIMLEYSTMRHHSNHTWRAGSALLCTYAVFSLFLSNEPIIGDSI